MRSRGWVVVGVGLAGAAIAAGLAATGRLPVLAHAWETLASGSASASASDIASSPASDAGAGVDAGKKVRPQSAPLSSAQLGGPLVNGAFVTACGAPSNMKIVVKVTVKMGRATDVDVQTDPPDTAVTRCVEDAIRDKRWDPSVKTDHVTARY